MLGWCLAATSLCGGENFHAAPKVCSTTTGGIRGRLIHLTDDLPVAAATVTCIGTNGRGYSSTSDTQGHFRIGMLPPGHYRISATKPTSRGDWMLLPPGDIEVRADCWTVATTPPFGICGNGADQWIRLEQGRTAFRFDPEGWVGLTLGP